MGTDINSKATNKSFFYFDFLTPFSDASEVIHIFN